MYVHTVYTYMYVCVSKPLSAAVSTDVTTHHHHHDSSVVYCSLKATIQAIFHERLYSNTNKNTKYKPQRIINHFSLQKQIISMGVSKKKNLKQMLSVQNVSDFNN